MWGHPPYPGVVGEGSLVGGAAFGAPIDKTAVLLCGVAALASGFSSSSELNQGTQSGALER
eukprot:scaffold3086_cov146-Isochrysis_galbana.AAC.1